MGVTVPPDISGQLADAVEDDPHESVTIAPPAPKFDELLNRPSSVPASMARDSERHLRAALDAGARAGTSLSEIGRIMAELTGGVTGARQANEQLLHELATLRQLLSSATDHHVTLRLRIKQLEQEVVEVQGAAMRERNFLTAQHDDFLAGLLEEHEDELRSQRPGPDKSEGSDAAAPASVAPNDDGARPTMPGNADLVQKLLQTEAQRSQAEAALGRARETMTDLQTQRDEAQARAERLQRERDELRAEASQLRARLGASRPSSPPISGSSPKPPSFHPPALELDKGELDATLHARSSSPRFPTTMPRLTPARPEVGRSNAPSTSATPAMGMQRVSTSPEVPRVRPAASPEGPRVRLGTNPGLGGYAPYEPPPKPDFGPRPTGWTPVPPADVETLTSTAPTAPPEGKSQPGVSAANMPATAAVRPILRPKPDPSTRPLTDYSLGGEGLTSETLEGARLSSKPPKK